MADIYTFFGEKELACRCGCGGGQEDMRPETMRSLIAMRASAGFPFVLSSAYRCPAHDKAVGGAGVHTTGQAVDILVSGHRAYKLLAMAKAYGFTGIGISQRGEHGKRFIHLDDTEGDTRPWVWSY